jgi:DNA replicative helicase MCM subunit Mcm2 (Cdc46/Mcm family)
MLVAKIVKCETCGHRYVVYYDRGETDDKNCPNCIIVFTTEDGEEFDITT